MENAVVSITSIHAGDAFNVIPESVEMGGTVRTLREEVRTHIEEQLARLVPNIAAGFDATGTIEYVRHYPVTVNHEAETLLAAQAAMEVAGEDRVSLDMPPVLGGEDFSFMLNEVPGAMVFLGGTPHGSDLSKAAPNHSNRVFFEESAMATGIALYASTALRRLAVT